jgi:hypothetical protein
MPTFVTEGPVTKAYVDAVAEGLHVLTPVQAATTANKTLQGEQTIDGVGVVAGNRVLVKDQSTASENGVYLCVDGAWTRTEDFDEAGTSSGNKQNVRLGDFVFCEAGTANAGHGFVMTGASNFNSSGTAGSVGTNNIEFTQFSGITTTVTVNQGGTGATSLTDGGILLGSGTGAITALGVLTDGQMIVGDGTTDPVAESGATLRSSIGVGTGDSPQFTGIELGHATDTTITRASSGVIAVEGAEVRTGTVPVNKGGTGATSLTDGGILLGSGTGAITALGVLTDGQMIVGDGTTDPVAESGATLRTSIGVGTGDSPQFTGIELGHATDTTITRASAGDVNIQGNIIYRAGGTDVAVADGGTGLSSYAQGDIIYASATTTIAKLAKVGSDRVLTNTGTSNNPKWLPYSSVCFLKGTKITLPDKSQVPIEDLTLDDKVLTYNIDGLSDLKDKNKVSCWQIGDMNGSLSESGIRNIWVNPTDSYLVINNKLRVTNHHLIHFKRDNIYYFNFVEQLLVGDELLTDEENYEPIVSIEEVKENINVYNFELDKDQTYFADNYLVHHYCKLCSGYSNII